VRDADVSKKLELCDEFISAHSDHP
jgi:hypothetical protein